jgi:hypothetical protein
LLVGVFAVTLVAVAVYRASSLPRNGAAPLLLERLPGCRLAQAACRASGAAGSMQVIVAAGARSLQPFTVRVRLEGIQPRGSSDVSLEFSMHGMEMGPNRYLMRALPDNEWSADVILPLCTTRRVDWTLSILVRTVDSEVAAGFPLTL